MTRDPLDDPPIPVPGFRRGCPVPVKWDLVRMSLLHLFVWQAIEERTTTTERGTP